MNVLFLASYNGKRVQARIIAARIARENRRSVRFEMHDGTYMTIAKRDILSIG